MNRSKRAWVSWLAAALCVSSLGAATGCASQGPQTPSTTSPTVTAPAVAESAPQAGSDTQEAVGASSVASLRASPSAGSHTLDVWVVRLKPCPECPPTLSCKPCAGEFIMVADEAAPAGGDDALLGIVVPASGMSQFQAGKRYRIEVEVNKGVPDSKTLSRVDLVRLVSVL